MTKRQARDVQCLSLSLRFEVVAIRQNKIIDIIQQNSLM